MSAAEWIVSQREALRTADDCMDASMALPKALDALAAVLAVHRPLNAVNAAARPGRQATQVCRGCGTDAGNWEQWPCPTIRAIETALGVKP